MSQHRRAPVFRDVQKLRAYIKDAGAEQVVLSNGCFDPLHVGHIRYLEGARQNGDFLIVALNDDVSTRSVKGSERPVVSENDRAEILAALKPVDAVLLFSQKNVSSLLEALRPKYHAKGTDYTVDTVPERETSRRLGIQTVIAGDEKSHASSEVLARLREKDKAKGEER
ncbi:MAG: adenylyltransferase/cytidyltransferase family protein [Candidatus Latescibacterota bacterium]